MKNARIKTPARQNLLTATFIILSALTAGSAAADEWTSRAWNLVTDGDDKVEESEISLVGRILEQDDQDEDGNPISRAFLEQDDGSLIPLPCERSKGDAGAAKRLAGKATAGIRDAKDTCWDYLGQEVKVLGTAQSVQRKTKRYRRLMNITGISPIG